MIAGYSLRLPVGIEGSGAQLIHAGGWKILAL